MTTPTPDPMREALALIEIVEGIAGTMKHGTWRDENGMRLKDTPEWVAFYNATRTLAAAPQPAPASSMQKMHSAPADREALVGVIRRSGDFMSGECRPEAIADALLAAGWRRADQAALDAAYRKGQEDMRERAAMKLDEMAEGMRRIAEHPKANPDNANGIALICEERAASIRSLTVDFE